MTASADDVIVVGRGRNRGIWCRTQAAFDVIAAAAEKLPPGEATRLSGMPVPGSYPGTLVAVASPEKWQELEAELEAASHV